MYLVNYVEMSEEEVIELANDLSGSYVFSIAEAIAILRENWYDIQAVKK